ncbi:MAG: matrixin family metalloprotease [Planctomycetales bacterium]|nr:matrixin family metalloprotease [Planctomycetales bacterium]
MHHSRQPPGRRRFVVGRIEPLELRLPLDAENWLLAETPNLTISFAADGTEIAGEANSIEDTFQSLGPEWRQTVLRAFQTWFAETNANLAIIEDQGQPFGSSGLRRDDGRFGDIRLGARPLTDDVMAISVSHSSPVAGTWAGDVVFNSAANFQSLDDLYAVALHEAGHVLGLKHSDDPTSVMHVHGVSENVQLTVGDIDALQSLYGARQGDASESEAGFTDNDVPLHAAEFEAGEAIAKQEGTAPALVFGDLTQIGDTDYYELEAVKDYTGPLTIEVTTAGISLLQPRLTVYTAPGSKLLGQVTTTATSQGRLLVSLPQAPVNQSLWIRVDSEVDDVFAIGAYSLVATFDDLNRIDAETVDAVARSQFRQLNAAEFDDYFDLDAEHLIHDDAHTDDDAQTANALLPLQGSALVVRYEFVGSISDLSDVDVYRITTPPDATLAQLVTITVGSLDAGGMIPQLRLLDNAGQELATQTLVNGNGELVVQATGLSSQADYLIEVAPHAGSLITSGNYSLGIVFGGTAVAMDEIAAGTIGSTGPLHTFYVGRPQLVHFAFSATHTGQQTGALLGRIHDKSGQIVQQIVVAANETRTAGSLLLSPGTYQFSVATLVENGQAPATFAYSLQEAVFSDPFGVDPLLPSSMEFSCPDMTGVFCYPNGVMSVDPFLWDLFVTDYSGSSSIVVGSLEQTLQEAWWSWYQDQAAGNHVPVAVADSYQVEQDGDLSVPALRGLLLNDFDPDLDVLSVVVHQQPSHGTLQLDRDGGFYFQPDPGYSGPDSFTYRTADAWTLSQPAQVSLIVVGNALPGDFNNDGIVDGIDLETMRAAIGGEFDPRFDLNLDDVVDSSDWQLMVTERIGTTFGDANLDGVFDSSDIVVVFQAGRFEDTTATDVTWAQGDWDADGRFTTSDLILAFQTGAYQGVAAALAKSASARQAAIYLA